MAYTIVDSILAHAELRSNQVAFRYLRESEQMPSDLTYRELLDEAGAIAEFLEGLVAPGSRVMLLFPPGTAYIKAFCGCLLAGMIAVPLYPPHRNGKSDRIMSVALSCHSTIALTIGSELNAVKTSWAGQNMSSVPLKFFAIDQIVLPSFPVKKKHSIDSNIPAFLQYTSGSTGVPKGVVITHQNIMANLQHLIRMSDCNEKDVFVNWLPLFHDLGLVTAVLLPLYLGCLSVLMAPADFVRSPVKWLMAIHEYRGSICGGPNFAYDLCVNKISNSELQSIDLSSWRIAFNAAEQVKSATLEDFSNKFNVCGYRKEAFYPSYGMAEAVAFISGGDPALNPVVFNVDKDALAENRAVLTNDPDVSAVKFVSCGKVLFPHDIRIVDPKSKVELTDRQIGEIWFSGPSVSPAYWHLAEKSNVTFNQKIVGNERLGNTYLRTGDLGFLSEGELFVTGRIKDLIILQGKNYYPHDIELSATKAHSAVRTGRVAAFSLNEDGLEKVIVLAELERSSYRNTDPTDVVSAIRQAVVAAQGINVDRVVVLKPNTIPTTSSGKIKRKASKRLLLDGAMDAAILSGRSHDRNYLEPRSDIERLLCNIWRRFLKVERIGITDDFFGLGGSSLIALEISAEVQKQIKRSFAVDLDVEHLLDFRNVAELARFVELKIVHADSKEGQVSSPLLNVVRI